MHSSTAAVAYDCLFRRRPASGRRLGFGWWLPAVREQLVYPRGRVGLDAEEHVGEVGDWVDEVPGREIGRWPFLFRSWIGDFWKRIGNEEIRSEVRKLERLARELERVQDGDRS